MTLNDLQRVFRTGSVESILVRSARLDPVTILDKVNALQNLGLEGDHYKNKGGTRQVTLIQAEHLDVLASLLESDKLGPEVTRRNLVIRGINLLSLKGKQFNVGEALLEYSGECHPCSRMEKNLGPGAYNAMRGHGGITARVINSGIIKVGDPVSVFEVKT